MDLKKYGVLLIMTPEQSIPNYPTYSITREGYVRDLRTGNLHNGHSFYGYRKVTLTNPQGTTTKLIHRIVAEVFIPNPNNLPEVDHINRICDDNRVENLRWADDYIQAQNKGNQKNNTTGYKNIMREDNMFRVVIKRNGKNVARKRFHNLDDAIKYRDEIISCISSCNT